MNSNVRRSMILLSGVGLVTATIFLISYLVLASHPPESTTTPQVKDIAGYKNWTRVNSEPQLMPERVAAACAMVLPNAGVVVDGRGNPHRNKYFVVYVNNIGQQAMLEQKNPAFLEGSVIVKEKLAAKDSTAPELLTVMIKQSKGFDPSSGDWEYMVVDGKGVDVQGRGRLENCQGCHLATQKTDYVFRTYLPKAP